MSNGFWSNLQDRFSILCPYYWKNLWYKVKCVFNPRNKWASTVIPREWQDKDTIFENLLFAGIIDYVEREKCFETIDWKGSGLEKEEKELREVYKWAKYGKIELENKINNAYPSIELYKINKLTTEGYKKLYGEVNRLDELLFDINTTHLNWIVNHRNILWT
jgi:hypothetical protein